MVKHTQTIRRQQPANCLSVFDHFARLVLKGLTRLIKPYLQEEKVSERLKISLLMLIEFK